MVSVDGTKVDVSASKRNSLRYDRATELREQLQKEIAGLMEEAERGDGREGWTIRACRPPFAFSNQPRDVPNGGYGKHYTGDDSKAAVHLHPPNMSQPASPRLMTPSAMGILLDSNHAFSSDRNGKAAAPEPTGDDGETESL